MNLILKDNKVYNATEINVISPGSYVVDHDMMHGVTSLAPIVMQSDKLVDIPDSTYMNIVDEVTNFFTEKTKNKFEHFGFVYKKAILLHGIPGTGKTCTVIKIMNLFLEKYDQGVVLFNPHIMGMKAIFNFLGKDVPILVIYEEFDGLFKQVEESHVLNLLDGEEQRANTVFLFTTNYIDKIPKRMLRPGRISNIIEVKVPTLENRKAYLKAKLPHLSEDILDTWAKNTDGLTIDDLKYTVLNTQCLDFELSVTVKRLKETRELMQEDDEDDYDDEENRVRDLMRGFGRSLR